MSNTSHQLKTPNNLSPAQTRIPENRDEYLTFLQKSTFPINRPHNCLTITPKH